MVASGGQCGAKGVDPVAVIGMGCRFPGGLDSMEQFWRFVSEGEEATGMVPAERWEHYNAANSQNARALLHVTRNGAFLTNAAGFDAEFFGVTPREAELMDPQQRITLEVVWQALEHAGIPPGSLAGTDTGVFVGVGSDDYGRQMLEDLPRIEAWTGIGAAMCGVANRVSYVLDLRGPSLAVDTACSASLVAIHLACTSLRLEESTLAIAGGVNLIAGPGLTMVLDAAGATSPDGRSRSFDASADGYGRGEGCGVLVLKRLADADRDGDRVLAVIRGSAVNQDGHTNGIMAPNGDAQEYVVRRALRQAGVPAETVDYVEAHGTGTRMGDPIEVAALSKVYGRTGADGPCLLSSVKSNIGHLEAGAGVAGMIKTVLALMHGEIPPIANLNNPNPDIDWDNSGLALVFRRQSWPHRSRARRAGVSGFGYGGTVSHVILEEAPPRTDNPSCNSDQVSTDGAGLRLFPVSGASAAAVRHYAGKLAGWLQDEGRNADLADVAHTLIARRTHLSHRAAIVTNDLGELSARLQLVADGGEAEGVVVGKAVIRAPADPVWVFSGHGSQWSGMGRELLSTEPVFAAVIDTLAPVFTTETDFNLPEVLLTGDLGEVSRIQPVTFAIQVALAELLQAQGLRPAAVIGHSVGEISAAVAAGALTLLDGARLICRRSALLRRVIGKGSMALVGLPFAVVQERLAGHDDVVAAISASPESTVISGDPSGVRALRERWNAEGLVIREVNSDVAFHSPQMDPLLDELKAATKDLIIKEPSISFYPTALTDPRARPRHDGAYWAANLRNPVQLTAAVTAAVEDGHRLFLEVSAHPVVTHSIAETLSHLGVEDGFVTGTLQRRRSERLTLMTNLAALYCQGALVRWPDQQPGQLISLPLIAWQHKQYWRTRHAAVGRYPHEHDVRSHTLLGTETTVAGVSSLRLWQTRLDSENRPYPDDHTLHGVEVVPASVVLNTFLEAGHTCRLADVTLTSPVPVNEPHEVEVVYSEPELRLASRLVDAGTNGADRSWLSHATARAIRDAEMCSGRLDLDDVVVGAAAHHWRQLDPGDVVARLHRVGATAAFRWEVTELQGADGEIIATVRTHQDREQAVTWAPVFDAVLAIAELVFPGEVTLRMPTQLKELIVSGIPPTTAVVDVRLRDNKHTPDTLDIMVATETGEVVARMTELHFGSIEGTPGANPSSGRLLHQVEWVSLPAIPAVKAFRPVVVVGGQDLLTTSLCTCLTASGVEYARISQPEELAGTPLIPGADVVVLPSSGDARELNEAAAQVTWRLARTAQVLAEVQSTEAGRLWAVTTGQRELSRTSELAQAPLWGLGRIIAGEHPELWGGIVDIAAEPDPADLRTLTFLLQARPHEDVLTVRSGAAETARLALVSGSPVRPALECRPEASYLITGGLGVLGLEVARWLVSRGARRLILAGRTGLPPREGWDHVTEPGLRNRIEVVRALEALGVTVRVVALDVSDLRQSRRLLDTNEMGLPPIRGVVHAAGVLDNRMLHDLDEESLRRVMRPKVTGALTLNTLFPPGSVDFLALFSSNGLLLGLPGQASYASANAFLDGLARHRHSTGHRDTISLAWTSWRAMGMAVNDVVEQELRERGVGVISAIEAFRAWTLASRYDAPHIVVMPTIEMEPGREILPVLRQLEFQRPANADGADTSDGFSIDLEPEELRIRVTEEVAVTVGAEIQMSITELDTARLLAELGLDSVMMLAIRRKLEKRFRLALPATLMWTAPTITAVADYLTERLLVAEQPVK